MTEKNKLNEEDEVNWDETSKAWEIATDRTFGPSLFGSAPAKNQEPFLVESFCAQVAWMGKHCPVYPFVEYDPRKMCTYLTQKDYENYRCPAICDPESIFQGIIERGTPEQKKALETLADVSVRYAVNPPKKFAFIHRLSTYASLGKAIRIYRMLGLEEKMLDAEDKWRELNTGHADFDKMKRVHEEWAKEQAEIDREADKKFAKLREDPKWKGFFGENEPRREIE